MNTRYLMISLGSFFLCFGILSFLIPEISKLGTLILLVLGGGLTVYGAWFSNKRA